MVEYHLEEKPRGSFAELFRNGILFNFGKLTENTIETLFNWTTCKDFLTDVIWCEKMNKPFSKYSFNYKPSGLLESKFFLLIKHDSETVSEENALILCKILNFWEDRLNIKNSNVVFSNGVLIVDFDYSWFDRPYMFALFTNLAACYNIREDWQDIDSFLKLASKRSYRVDNFINMGGKMNKIWNGEITNYVDYSAPKDSHAVHYDLGLDRL